MSLFKILLITLFAQTVLAQEAQSTKIYNPYSSIRALGMGNAFTAVADDYSLIMYNPAGFARKKHNEFQVSLVGAGLASKTLSVANDIKNAADTPGSDTDKANAVSAVLDQYYGKTLGGKVQALELMWIRKYWGIALLPMDLNIDMTINRQVGPAIELNVVGDSTVAFGYGTDLSDQFDAGITLKYIHRVFAQEIVPALEIAQDSNVLSAKRFKEGTAFDFDLGFMWTPDWFVSKKKPKPTPVAQPISTEVITPPVKSSATESSGDLASVDNTDVMDSMVAEPSSADSTRTPQQASVGSEDKTKAATQSALDLQIIDLDTKQNTEVPKSEPEPVAQAKEKAEVLKTDEEKAKEAEAKSLEEEADVEADIADKDRLSFGLVVHNVIGSSFSLSKQVNKDAIDAPPRLDRVIDVGSQYRLYNGEDLIIRYMLDFKNILHPQITVNKSFHTGLEMDYSPSTWFKTQFRVGVNQMYYTAGVSFLFGILQIDAATYGEEVGTTSTKVENRVYAAKVGFNF